MIYEFNGIKPVIKESSFIHPQANVTGNVIIGKNCILEENTIIGPNTSIGDNSKIVINGDPSQIDLPHKNILRQ